MHIEELYARYRTSKGVSTDTRKMDAGGLFFALKGPRFNANELAHEALERGAAYAVIDAPEMARDSRYIVVEDSLKALQQLAAYHRSLLQIPIIAITGSNGKTTSKELAHVALSARYKTVATQGNLNNHIGVPLTLLSIDASAEAAVIEMGASHVGEIALLCAIANPTHGTITNIGQAHVGAFGSMENIVQAKGELYTHLQKRDRAVWVNAHDAILVELSQKLKNPMFYPEEHQYLHCTLADANPFVVVRTEQGREIQTQLAGEYNFENIALALAIGKYFQVKERLIAEALASYKPELMRSQLIRRGGNAIVLDAYNANPTSMKAAIKSLSQMNAKRKVAILGDMHELGDGEVQAHAETAAWAEQLGVDEIYLCGKIFSQAKASNSHVRVFPSVEALTDALRNSPPIRDSAILLKASRGMALERLLELL